MKKKYFGFGIWLIAVVVTGVVSHCLLGFTLMNTLAACAIVGIISSLVINILRKEKHKFGTREIIVFILTVIIVVTIGIILGLSLI